MSIEIVLDGSNNQEWNLEKGVMFAVFSDLL